MRSPYLVKVKKTKKPLKIGDIVRRWGTRFKRDDRASLSIGPRMVVCELVDEDTAYVVPTDKFPLTYAWVIARRELENNRVIGTYLGKAEEVEKLVVWEQSRDKIKKVEHCH